MADKHTQTVDFIVDKRNITITTMTEEFEGKTKTHVAVMVDEKVDDRNSRAVSNSYWIVKHPNDYHNPDLGIFIALIGALQATTYNAFRMGSILHGFWVNFDWDSWYRGYHLERALEIIRAESKIETVEPTENVD